MGFKFDYSELKCALCPKYIDCDRDKKVSCIKKVGFVCLDCWNLSDDKIEDILRLRRKKKKSTSSCKSS